MAVTAEETISVYLQGYDNISGAFSTAGDAISAFNDAFETVVSTLANVAEKVIATEAVILALGATLATVSIDKAGAFSDGIAQISTLTSQTGDELAQFSQDVATYASTSVFSFEEINAALLEANSSGVAWQDSIEFIAAAEKLATATKSDLNSVVGVLTSSMNAYGSETEGVTAVSDSLFQAIKAGKIEMDDLSTGIGNATVTASGLGIPLDVVSAALATMTSKGLGTSDSITNLNSLLTALSSVKAQEEAEKLGLEFDSTTIASDGLKLTLEKVITATGGSSESLQTLLGTQEAVKAVTLLTSEDFKVFSENLELMGTKAGATAEAYDKMVETFENVNARLTSSMDAAFISVGLPLLEQYGDSVTALASVFSSLTFAVNADAFQPITDLINSAGAKLETLLKDLASDLPKALDLVDFTSLAESLGELFNAIKSSLGSVFDEFDLSTPKGVADALQLMVDAFDNLTKVATGIVESMGPVFSAIGAGLDTFSKSTDDMNSKIGEMLGQAVLIDQFGLAFGILFSAMEKSGVSFTDVIATIGPAIDLMVAQVQEAFYDMAAAVTESLSTVVGAISSIPFTDADGSLAQLAESLGVTSQAYSEHAKEAEAALDAAKGVWESGGYGDTVDKILTGAEDTIKGWGDTVTTVFGGVGDDVNTHSQTFVDLGDIFDKTATKASDMVLPIGEFQDSLKSTATTVSELVTELTGLDNNGFAVVEDSASSYLVVADKVTDSTGNMTDANDKLTDASKSLVTAKDAETKSAVDLELKMASLAKTYASIEQGMVDSATKSSQVQQGWAALDVEVAKLKVSAEEAGIEIGEIGTHYEDAGKKAANSGVSFSTVLDSIKSFAEEFIAMVESMGNLDPAAVENAENMVNLGIKTLELKNDLESLKNASSETALGFAELDIEAEKIDVEFAKINLSYAELANSLAEKNIELNIAGIQAQSEQMQAIAQTISSTFTSTGDVIGGLFGTWAQLLEGGLTFDESKAVSAIEESLELENEYRSTLIQQLKDQMDMQILMFNNNALMQDSQLELNAAQKAYLEAKTEKIESGEGLKVTVFADGLQTQLEYIYREILEGVQGILIEEGAEGFI